MTIRFARRLATALSLAAAASGLVMTTAPAQAAVPANQPPVAVGDTVHLYAGDVQSVDVLANDSDPDGDSVLQVCRVGTPSSKRIYAEPATSGFLSGIADRRQGGLALFVEPSTPAGTYTVPYQACDTDYLVPATLTIEVSRLPRMRVVKVRHRPGHLRVTNPSDFTGLFGWAAPRGYKLDGTTRIAPHRSALVRVTRPVIRWFGATAGRAHHFLGGGVVRHIRLPAGHHPTQRASRPSSSTARALIQLAHRETRPFGRPSADTDGAWPASTFQPVDLSTTVPPTAVPDARTVWAGASVLDLLGNDSEPGGGQMDICRVDVSDRQLDVENLFGDPIVDTSRARAGVHTFTYYACNQHRLAGATVTLTVRRAKPLVVRVVKGHPSQVRVHNPNPVRAFVAILSSDGADSVSGTAFPVRGHHTRWVPVHTRYAIWLGEVGQGGIAGHGKLRNVPLTADDAKHDKSQASDVNEGQQFIDLFRPGGGRIADTIRARLAATR